MMLPSLNLSAERSFTLSSLLSERLDEMTLQAIDAAPGPEEFRVMGIAAELVFTKEAWPHTDPIFSSKTFFTMTVVGDMFEFGTLSKPTGVRLRLGHVFQVDPLEVHWLRPDPVVSEVWVALQWTVPRESASVFAEAMAAAIPRWNEESFSLPMLGTD